MQLKNENLKTIKPHWKGNYFVNGQFSNSDKPDIQLPLSSIFKWKTKKSPWAEEKKNDTFMLNVIKNNSFIKNHG